MNELTFEQMLEQICDRLAMTPKGEAAYTMLLGAGFSYGVIPTAREILTDAPEWLHLRRQDRHERLGASKRAETAAEFWRSVAEKGKERTNSIQLDYEERTGLPTSESTSDAYKLLMSAHCPGGLTTPDLRRDFMRYLCSNAIRRNNPAHLFLACLLNRQRKANWKYQGRFCKTILTTNFDHLLQHALQLVNVLYYMSDRPEALDYLVEDAHEAIHLVYTHGSIHRYRLLNSTDEIEDGKKNSSALKSHFERHGVIVTGYGGWADATMDALYQAHQFDGNLFWCVRRGASLSKTVTDLLDKHAPCAFKVTIPDADEAMHRIFERLTEAKMPELLDDPISLLTTELDGLHFTGGSSAQPAGEQSEYIHSFNNSLENSLARLKVARQAYVNPEKYDGGETADSLAPRADRVLRAVSAEVKARAVVSKYMDEAMQLASANRIEEAIELWSKVLGMEDIPTEQRARTLLNRGVAYGKLHPPRREEQLADYSAVIAMAEASPEQKAMALNNRGFAYGQLDPPRREEQLRDISAVITMAEVSPEWKAIALNNRGFTYSQWDPPRREEQLADYSAVIAMAEASPERKAIALNNRGVTYGLLDPPRREKELADFSAVIAMPDVPPEQKAIALFNRGNTYGQLDPPRREKQLADYSAVIAMVDAPPEEKAMALNSRSITYGELELPRREEQRSDCHAVLAMGNAPASEIARAHGLLGLLDFDEREDAQALFEHNKDAIKYVDHYDYRYNLGLAALFLGRPKEALKNCLAAIDECTEIRKIDGELQRLKAKLGILPEVSKAAYEEIRKKLNERKEKLMAADESAD